MRRRYFKKTLPLQEKHLYNLTWVVERQNSSNLAPPYNNNNDNADLQTYHDCKSASRMPFGQANNVYTYILPLIPYATGWITENIM
jgi:hypothetical protein